MEKDGDEDGKFSVACGLRLLAKGLVDCRIEGEDETGELVAGPVGIMD